MNRNGIQRSAALALVSLLAVPSGALAQATPAAPADIERRVESILSQMTLEEKVDLLGGVDGFFVRGVPRLGVPRFKTADGPLGVRNYGPATAMAGGIALTANWDPALAERLGTELGRDARAKGVHFLLGPGVNIYRAPMNGRNFEYFGEDPFLASRIAVGYVKGLQSQGVSATIKHFTGNNSEIDRHNSDSIIDERTMREIYLPVFEAAVKEAHVGAIMDSYNLTNGVHMSQNGSLNIDLVKKEWGFDGIMMSDWVSTYDTLGCANGGLDLEMPFGAVLNREKLLPAIQKGQVSVATIDDKIRRILRTGVRFSWLDRDQTDVLVPRLNPDGRRVSLESARGGMVLLKNEGGLLPLSKQKIKTLAVIGPDAHPAVPVGGGSAQVEAFRSVSMLEGLSNALAPGATVYYRRGIPSLSDMAESTPFETQPTKGEPGLKAEYFDNPDLKGDPFVARTEPNLLIPAPFRPKMPEKTESARWTGYFTPEAAGSFDVFVASTGDDGGYHRLFIDDALVFDDWTLARALVDSKTMTLDKKAHKILLEQHGRPFWGDEPHMALGIVASGSMIDPAVKTLAAKADAVVIAAGFDPETESEGSDRTFRLPVGQDDLIRAVLSVNKNTIVVVTSGGAVDLTPWLDEAPAVLEAWYPGQEGGTAVADLVFGDVNPSGRLPISWEKRQEDNPSHDNYYPVAGTNRIEYKEGIFVGYRGFEHAGTKPLFPFGFGLSYTTFKYQNLAVKPLPGGGPAAYEVSFDVTNTGSREGSDVAQVYVSEPGAKVPRPPKELKGFKKVKLAPQETARVSVALDRRSFSYYDVKLKAWHATQGPFDVLVGESSAQIELKGQITLTPATALPR